MHDEQIADLDQRRLANEQAQRILDRFGLSVSADLVQITTALLVEIDRLEGRISILERHL